jgi:hypothetical protein
MKGSIRLTAAERKMLLSVYRTARDAKRARRAHVILLLDEGVSYRELTRWLFVSNDLIADCVYRFQHGRVEALLEQPVRPSGVVPVGCDGFNDGWRQERRRILGTFARAGRARPLRKSWRGKEVFASVVSRCAAGCTAWVLCGGVHGLS